MIPRRAYAGSFLFFLLSCVFGYLLIERGSLRGVTGDAGWGSYYNYLSIFAVLYLVICSIHLYLKGKNFRGEEKEEPTGD